MSAGVGQSLSEEASVYDTLPWLSSYPPGHLPTITPEHATALEMFRSAVAVEPGKTAIEYFGRSMSFGELDEQSDALATYLQERGFTQGDRLALYLQNVPQWVLGLLAAWKAGGAAVAINPMNRERELGYLLGDSGAKALVCHPALYEQVASRVVGDSAVELVLSTSELDYLDEPDTRIFSGIERTVPAGTEDLVTVIERYVGRRPAPSTVEADDVAVLTYTSGTTGVSKGAMNTHGNMVFTAQVFRDWIGIGREDVILGGAPLFHITGLIGHIGLSFSSLAPIVLTYRFDPAVVHDLVVRYRPSFTIMAITAFGALMRLGADRGDYASLKKVYSGGAAVAPAMRDRVKQTLGLDVHQAYGLTETTSPSHLQPLGSVAPVDDVSGALSVGIPVYDTVVRIVDESGRALPAGGVGEIEIEGPQVVPGYWRKPEATAESLPGGRLRTGDVGFMSPEGWFFIVDRKKDMINAAGYKVWPREVEDVLYSHPAVNEVAVVGVPDEYRGETVKAWVSLKVGEQVTPEELIEFCRARLAAYKYPRLVELIDELPKTTTGKILRRELRGG